MPAAVDTQPFFQSKKAAAVLKHAILSGYVPPFVSKTGSASPDHRVVIVDGYAGAGRYGDDQDGSPALLAHAARGLPFRKITGLFVEQDAPTYEALCAVLEDEAPENMNCTAYLGRIEDHLDELLAEADGLPLLVFLDPFGLGLSFDLIKGISTARQGRAATEILIRFDANAVRRIRGLLHSSKPALGKDKTLARMDSAAGGTWWRDEDDNSKGNAEYLDWFIDELLDRLCTAMKCYGWSNEVLQKQGQQPAYYMIFLTRHTAGLEKFTDALSLAYGKWRRAVFDEAMAAATSSGQGLLTDPDEEFREAEAALAANWIDVIEAGLRDVLAAEEKFIVLEHMGEVFGTALGYAREMHLRTAMKRLQADGSIYTVVKGSLWKLPVVRA
jgi:three-Cys-motif partner protein